MTTAEQRLVLTRTQIALVVRDAGRTDQGAIGAEAAELVAAANGKPLFYLAAADPRTVPPVDGVIDPGDDNDRASAVLRAIGDSAETGAALGNTTLGHESVPLAIYAAVSQPNFENAVTFAIRCGGDTDTIAAMTGAIAGARLGADAIPQRWLERLEDGERGRSYVEQVATELVEGPPRRERRRA